MDKEPLYNIEDFVGVFDNFFDDTLTDRILWYFNQVVSNGCTVDRQTADDVPKHIKDDTSSFNLTDSGNSFTVEEWHEPCSILNKILWDKIFPVYENEYSVIKHTHRKYVQYCKLQESKPGQGYHAWHYEAENPMSSLRMFAFILYLNDIEQGGETEFLYQKKRVKPVKNRFLLWPAYFTHTHRGNPPLAETKYILTGHILMG